MEFGNIGSKVINLEQIVYIDVVESASARVDVYFVGTDIPLALDMDSGTRLVNALGARDLTGEAEQRFRESTGTLMKELESLPET